MAFTISDELLGTFVPILIYWLYSGLYVVLGSFDKLENYRLHPRNEEDEKNLVSKGDVVKGVLLQQFFQAIVAILLFAVRNLFSFYLISLTFYICFYHLVLALVIV